MPPLGHSRRFDHVGDGSDLPPIPRYWRHRNKLTLIDEIPFLKIFAKGLGRFQRDLESEKGWGGGGVPGASFQLCRTRC